MCIDLDGTQQHVHYWILDILAVYFITCKWTYIPYIYTHTHTHIYIYICMCENNVPLTIWFIACKNTYVRTYIHTYIHVRKWCTSDDLIYRMYIHIHTYIRKLVHVRIWHTCNHVLRIDIHIHICIYAYIHITIHARTRGTPQKVLPCKYRYT